MTFSIPPHIKKEIKELLDNPYSKYPETEWEQVVDYLFAFEIILSRLKAHKILNKKQEKEIRFQLKKLTYWSCLNTPNIKNNEKIKKEVKLFCLNDYAFSIGLGKKICFIDSEDSA